jgi:hypothetical protein
MKVILLLLGLSVIGTPVKADFHSIKIVDSAGSECFEVPEGTSEFYIIAKYDLTAGADAEFRVSGAPPEWTVTATPYDGVPFVLGDPFDLGTNIALLNCFPENEMIVFTVNVFASAYVPSVSLTVTGHTYPVYAGCSPMMQCCTPPCFGYICLDERTATVNPEGGCAVAVEARSWATLKRLFR